MKTNSEKLPVPVTRLCIPEKVLEQHVVVLGKTGAGKSSKLRHMVEHLLSRGKRVCIIDPKGDWWGLKKSADGGSAGFPVIAFGDFKDARATDVPITSQSGKQIAELISSGNRPCIIGMRGWMPGQIVDFWIDFASTLFNSKSGELFLVLDEVHNIAPKGKIMNPKAGKCLHWTNRMLSEGRGLGIVCLIASQRPQKVHNDTLTSCETLVAARVIHKADRTAVSEWIEGCGDSDVGGQVLRGLAQLSRPEAWVWSPECGYGPEKVAFPLFTTFDSFAPPQLQKRISADGWGTVDLEEVKARLATVIEEVKANDPAELKAEVRRLKAELQRVSSQKSVVSSKEPEVREVSVLTAADLKSIEAATAAYAEVTRALGTFSSEAQRLVDPLNRMATVQQKYTGPFFIDKRKPMPSLVGAGPGTMLSKRDFDGAVRGSVQEVPGGLKRMMIALAQRPNLNKRQLGVRAGLSSTSGTFGTYLGKLRSNGWIQGSETLCLTSAGVAALGDYQPLPEWQELLRHWLGELGDSGAGRMLQALAAAYPRALTKAELGAEANISHLSGTFGTYLGKLRTLELVEGKSELRAAAEFFD